MRVCWAFQQSIEKLIASSPHCRLWVNRRNEHFCKDSTNFNGYWETELLYYTLITAHAELLYCFVLFVWVVIGRMVLLKIHAFGINTTWWPERSVGFTVFKPCHLLSLVSFSSIIDDLLLWQSLIFAEFDFMPDKMGRVGQEME